MQGEKTRAITVTVPANLIKLVEAEAQANDRSRSYQISSILADYFKERAK